MTNKIPQARDTALIGAGYWGKNLARVLNDLQVLHTLCDVSAGTLDTYQAGFEHVAKTTDVDAALSHPAVNKVVIAAPAALHHRLATRALENGKDVLVEKPLCLRVEQGRELVEMARARNRILMVGHLLHYHPCITKLRSLIAQGKLGRLHYATSNRLNLGKFRKEENALWSFAPHDISVILSLAGDILPDTVCCSGGSYLTDGVADLTLTAMQFRGGFRAHIHVNWLNPFKEQKLTVVGSEGMAVFDDTKPWDRKLMLFRNYLTWTHGQDPTPSRVNEESVEVVESEPLRNECLHFLECCALRRTPHTDGAEGLRVLQVLTAAQNSLGNEGRPEPVASPKDAAASFYAHPSAAIDPGAIIGAGTKIWHFSHVMSGAELGDGCNLGQNVVVGSRAKLGRNVKVQNNVSIYDGVTCEDDVFLGPSCVLTNVSNPRSQVNRQRLYETTLIRRGATVGANATIVCGVTLGQYCFIAAGAVVTANVPDYALMAGVPARRQGWMSRHGHVLRQAADGTMTCPETGWRYREVRPEEIQCLDWPESEPLPSHLSVGSTPYRSFREPRRE